MHTPLIGIIMSWISMDLVCVKVKTLQVAIRKETTRSHWWSAREYGIIMAVEFIMRCLSYIHIQATLSKPLESPLSCEFNLTATARARPGYPRRQVSHASPRRSAPAASTEYSWFMQVVRAAGTLQRFQSRMGNCDFWSSDDSEERRWIIDFPVLSLDF